MDHIKIYVVGFILLGFCIIVLLWVPRKLDEFEHVGQLKHGGQVREKFVLTLASDIIQGNCPRVSMLILLTDECNNSRC